MVKSNKQTEALKKASQTKRNDTRLKVSTTLRIMKEKNLPINFTSVAKLAGVSKTWIYGDESSRNEINKARNTNGEVKRMTSLLSTVNKKDKEIHHLKEKNTRLEKEIIALRKQLEIVYGELYKIKDKM